METPHTPTTEPAPPEEIEAAQSEAPSGQTDDPLQPLQMELARVTEEAQTSHDRWVRLAAEFDNYKKRTSREFGALIKNANEKLILQILPTLDSFERALQAARAVQEFDAFRQGVEMIYQQLMETFRREGLQGIEAVGQPFNPTRHEAVLAVDRPDQPPDTIVEEMERGYTFNEKVIRPTKVVVSRRPHQVTNADDGAAAQPTMETQTDQPS